MPASKTKPVDATDPATDGAVDTPPEDTPSPQEQAREGRVSAEDYQSQGGVTLYADQGYEFAPSNMSLPVITAVGVNMAREVADEVLEESIRYDGHVYELIEEGA